MNSFPISLQAPIKQPVKTTESKPAASSPSADSVDFAQLLGSVSAFTTETQPSTEGQQEALLEKLETLLASLEQLPKEELTPEQLEMLQAIMELMAQQLQPPEEKLQSSAVAPGEIIAKPLEQSQVPIEQPVPKELELSAPALEKLASSPPDQSKMIDLLEEAAEVLQKLTNAAAKESGTTGLSVDAEKLKQVFSQLTGLVDVLSTNQQKAETKIAAELVQQVEQVLKQVTGLQQEPINMIQPKEILQPAATSATANVAEIQTTPKEVVPRQQEPAPTTAIDVQSQPAVSGTEAAKSGPVPQRTEAAIPQATVRLANLVEDLGETLRGSFRLNGEGDSKQIKISIFPEHLGQMDIRLTSIDGKIVAQIFTSTLAAKEALDQQASLLRNSMMQQGITVEKIEISQQSSQNSFGQQSAHPEQRFAQQQKQGAATRNRNGYQRIEEDAAVIVRRQLNDGSIMKVDYTI